MVDLTKLYEFDIHYDVVTFDIETTGLNTYDSKVICIGVGDDKKVRKVYIGEDEVKMLRMFLDELPDDKVLVGYFSNHFDIPFLMGRCIFNRINPWKLMKIKKLDIYDALCRGVVFHSRRPLHRVARIFGMSYNDKYVGKDVLWLYNAGMLDEIKEHCISDVKLVIKAFNRLRPFIDLEYIRLYGRKHEKVHYTKI